MAPLEGSHLRIRAKPKERTKVNALQRDQFSLQPSTKLTTAISAAAHPVPMAMPV